MEGGNGEARREGGSITGGKGRRSGRNGGKRGPRKKEEGG